MQGVDTERNNRRVGFWLLSATAFLYLVAIVAVIFLN
jgi:hypothetical protein